MLLFFAIKIQAVDNEHVFAETSRLMKWTVQLPKITKIFQKLVTLTCNNIPKFYKLHKNAEYVGITLHSEQTVIFYPLLFLKLFRRLVLFPLKSTELEELNASYQELSVILLFPTLYLYLQLLFHLSIYYKR